MARVRCPKESIASMLLCIRTVANARSPLAFRPQQKSTSIDRYGREMGQISTPSGRSAGIVPIILLRSVLRIVRRVDGGMF